MPVKLSQSTRLERNKSSSKRLASGEVCRVNLPEIAARAANLFRLVLERAVDEGAVARELPRGSVGDVLLADLGGEDVGVRVGDVLKDGGVDAKVLGEDVFGGVVDPVVDHECCAVTC